MDNSTLRISLSLAKLRINKTTSSMSHRKTCNQASLSIPTCNNGHLFQLQSPNNSLKAWVDLVALHHLHLLAVQLLGHLHHQLPSTLLQQEGAYSYPKRSKLNWVLLETSLNLEVQQTQHQLLRNRMQMLIHAMENLKISSSMSTMGLEMSAYARLNRELSLPFISQSIMTVPSIF